MKNLKKWAKSAAKSKTIIFASLLAALSTIQAMLGTFTPYLSPESFAIFTLGVSVVIAVLRVLTVSPLSKK